MSNPRFIKLRNGVLVDANEILLVARRDINEYTVVVRNSPVSPRADADDVKFLEDFLSVQAVPEPVEEPKVVTS